MACVMDFTVDVHDDGSTRLLGDSPVICDSRGVSDASRWPTARLGITEKHASIEVTIVVNERKNSQCALEVGKFVAAGSRWAYQGCRETALRGGVAQEPGRDQVRCQRYSREEEKQRAEGRLR